MGNTLLVDYKLLSYGKISSTQNIALDIVAEGKAQDHMIIMADMQSAGRGRYKRPWISQRGNLYASFLYEIEERDVSLAYVIAVAIAETLFSFGVKPQIKWPNDILIDGKKVSGTLTEYSGKFVIIGIGINIKSCPKISKYDTTKLENYVNVSREEVLKKLMINLDKWRKADFFNVRKRWLDFAIGLNKYVKYRGEVLEFVDINENGALVLRKGTEYLLVYGDEIIM